MDDFNELSSFSNQLKNFPEEMNPSDIQDLSTFPRDSFVDHTPSNYSYLSNNKSQKVPFKPCNFPSENNDNSSSDDEDGYSESFRKTMHLYQQDPNLINNNNSDNKLNNNKFNNNNSYKSNNNKNQNNNVYNPFKNTRNPNIYYNNNKNINNNQYQKYNSNNKNQILNTKNFINNDSSQSQNLIPQDSEIVEEEEEEENEINLENQINEDFNQVPEIEKESIQSPTPTYDPKKLEELLSKCKKDGTPPSDEDFSYNSWTIFYPKNEKFFLWEKGKVIPNQVIIKNEDDPEHIEIYQGDVNSQNEKHGRGRLTTPKYVRIGTWRDDEFTGWGRESRINGDVFEGRFVDGAIYGKGINQNKKGNVYVGEFVDSKREGKGELNTAKIHYEGEFKYDKFNGKGKLIFVKQGHEYEGEFKNNEINGTGIFKWNNGETYEGEMTNGKMNGYGKYTYSTGQIYEGTYINGVKQGLGKLISPNNNIYEGEFNKGQPDGEGTLTINGKKFNVIYQNGKFKKKK